MMNKLILISIPIFLSTLMLSFSHAYDSPPLHTYPEWGVVADKIIIGKLINKKKITVNQNGTTHFCGYELEFEVIVSWKGGGENVIFFTTHSDIFNKNQTEYLVIGQKDPPDKSIFYECEGQKIDVGKYDYGATHIDQLILPILRDSEGRFSWVLFANRISGSGTCNDSDESINMTIEYPNISHALPISSFLPCLFSEYYSELSQPIPLTKKLRKQINKSLEKYSKNIDYDKILILNLFTQFKEFDRFLLAKPAVVLAPNVYSSLSAEKNILSFSIPNTPFKSNKWIGLNKKHQEIIILVNSKILTDDIVVKKLDSFKVIIFTPPHIFSYNFRTGRGGYYIRRD